MQTDLGGRDSRQCECEGAGQEILNCSAQKKERSTTVGGQLAQGPTEPPRSSVGVCCACPEHSFSKSLMIYTAAQCGP